MNRRRLAESVRTAARQSMIYTVLAVALASTASAASAEKNLKRTFNVSPGGLLSVEADGADISVSGGDANTVVVRIEARGSQGELDDLQLSAEPSGDGIRVEARHPSARGWFRWGSWRVETHIDVIVPRNYRVDAKTSGGEVRVQDIAGTARLRTSGGNVTARNMKGDFEGHTSGGNVRIESMQGSVNAHTSGGNVSVSEVKGDVDANTSGGDVRVVNINGRINAGTSGGSVRCELTGPNRGISATTSGGSVWVVLPKDTKGTLDAQSSGGHIDSDFPIATTRWSEHRLSGQINGGGEEIRVRSSGGSITLSASR